MKLQNITLIRPNMIKYRAKDALPALSMAILAARVPEGVTVTFYDDRIEDIPEDDSPDLVALTVETFTAYRAYSIAKEYRDRNIPVVMGGFHPTLHTEEVLEHADAVIVGDAEGAWEKLLEDFQNDEMKPVYHNDNSFPLTDYRLDRSIFEGKKYAPFELIQCSRGCRFACDFCSIEAFYKSKVRTRPIEDIVAEIKTLDRKKLFFFVDDNLFYSRERLSEFLKAITPLKIRWTCQISIDSAKDESLIKEMAASGCIMVLIGFESLNEENLKQIGKKWNTSYGTYREVIDKFHRHGIAIYGTFVFGYDYDTLEQLEESLKFAIDAKLTIANFNPLVPTPGSKLYKRLVSEGRMFNENWWTDPNFRYGNLTFNPKEMKAEEFAQKCFEVKMRFYSYPSIFKRIILSPLKFNLFRFGLSIFGNLLSRREIKKKQFKDLGI